MSKVFRFAPSPTGLLHLGSAYSALLNEQMAREAGGKLLLRIEDTDQTRCRPEHTQAIIEDLEWLGISFDTEVRVQSEHLEDYHTALKKLDAMGVTYRCSCSRKHRELRPVDQRDPEGQPLYDFFCRNHGADAGEQAVRIDMKKAVSMISALTMIEKDKEIACYPLAWGDVVVARKDTGTSYHLSVVVDDALQGVTDVVRGEELLPQTAIHRVLQELLGLPQPRYHHHPLVKSDEGRKLSKSDGDLSIRALRESGVSARDVRTRLGFG